MESLEVSAKTVEEAVERALKQLGLSRDQVEISVLNKGKAGFLGMGAEEATVKVTPLFLPVGKSAAVIARETLEELLKRMHLEARAELVSFEQEESSDIETQPIALEISGEDLGVLIGRRGETLAALQYIVRLIVAHQQKARVPLSIDVEGYKQRRYRSLRELALRLAQNAASSGHSMTLEPMPADERRIVHLALSVNPEVTTESIGEGDMRKVVIMPRKRQ